MFHLPWTKVGILMKIDNDEIVVWDRNCHMILGGKVSKGRIMVTNKKLGFISVDEPGLLGGRKKESDLFELEIGKVHDINLHERTGIDFPMVRVQYKEGSAFFTFPDHEPRPAVAAFISFVNSARMIERLMSVMRNLDKNLNNKTLVVGEKLPELKGGLPSKADEECHQCGKTLIDDEMDKISIEVNECISCVHDME